MITDSHRLTTREALGGQFSERALAAIISANVGQDRLAGQVGHDEFHFDNNRIEDSLPRITAPMLFLQGGRDYQVTDTDFEGWKRALTSRPDVRFKLYQNLNHLFIAGTGKSSVSAAFAESICRQGRKCLYFSFEESPDQIGCRKVFVTGDGY